MGIAVDDVAIPEQMDKILVGAEKSSDGIERQFRRGLITSGEKYQRTIDVWTKATEEITEAMLQNFDNFNPLYMMAQSGARGNIQQIRQLAGMRGLMTAPSGRIIELPIKANFREGLTVLEYFISTHGQRKGLADTAIRTSESGYLTRRLVDVAQDVIIREEDCKTTEGVTMVAIKEGNDVVVPLKDRIIGRVAVEDVAAPRGGQAIIAEVSGKVKVAEAKGSRKLIVVAKDGQEYSAAVPFGIRLRASDGDKVTAGDQLTEGSVNPHDTLRIRGIHALQNYLVQEIQSVYRSQGVDINDKHIEIIVRQMLRRVKVEEPGDTELLPGELVDKFTFEEDNAKAIAEGLEPAKARPVLLGITKASLATESFLSAASFQETARVLTDAATKGKIDPLIGMKENVIIGKLIPAGTGMLRYRGIKIATEV